MKKVLVVEDSADNLKLMNYALQRAGYEVTGVPNGNRAIQEIGKNLPNFVIMDISLPDIDGWEATRRIRDLDLKDHLPVIAITSIALAGDREKTAAAGCDGYFEKPINPLTIVAEIETLLGKAGIDEHPAG